MNILITGASGFIGKAVIQDLLLGHQHQITALIREHTHLPTTEVEHRVVTTIDGNTSYDHCLSEIDVIIHLAARVHQMSDNPSNSFNAYKSINVDGTINLAKQAAKAGVKRFIYLSSIKVIGESSLPGKPIKADDPPNPSDPYALSKYQAELGLMDLCKKTKMQYVIIRPPLVYGPGVKANFQKLMHLIMMGLPLPLGGLNNLRSIVSIHNLTSLITKCITHPNAANHVYLVSDDRDISTTELIKLLADALSRPSRLIKIPLSLLMLTSNLTGKADIANRLIGSLQVDITKTKNDLAWTPSTSMESSIRETAQYYLQHKQ